MTAETQSARAGDGIPAGWKFDRAGDVIKAIAPDGTYWCVVRDDTAREDKIGAFFWTLCDALAAAPAVSAPAWQPIETAPLEIDVLVWSRRFGGPIVSSAFSAGNFTDNECRPLDATHWIPLPVAPEFASPVTQHGKGQP